MLCQEYVPQPNWQTVHLPPVLYDNLGSRLLFHRFALSPKLVFSELTLPFSGFTTRYVASFREKYQKCLIGISYHGALFARFVLGFVEAAFFPGALYLIARWYKRSELSQRTAYFTCGSLISNAFGSLIASGILDMMDGVSGYAAWRWLFFVEGGVTVLVAVVALFILPDFPETASISWLTPAEHALAKWRMVEDNGGASAADSVPEAEGDSLKLSGAMAGLALAFFDWKVWYLAVGLFFYALALSFHLYFPTLTATMGYDPIITLLLCTPPWIFATGWALWLSRHSDNTGDRCIHVVSSLMIGIIGFLLSMSTMNIAVRYFSL